MLTLTRSVSMLNKCLKLVEGSMQFRLVIAKLYPASSIDDLKDYEEEKGEYYLETE
jgi:hypothetical protein